MYVEEGGGKGRVSAGIDGSCVKGNSVVSALPLLHAFDSMDNVANHFHVISNMVQKQGNT